LVIPLTILQFFTFSYYSPDKGDLLRIGYLVDKFPEYREIFKSDFNKLNKVLSVSKLSRNSSYDLLTIGDSFSEQGNIGFQNQIALSSDLKVVHLDRRFHKNQIQVLIGLVNSGFFDNHAFDFVLVEFIEAGTRDISSFLDPDFVFNTSDFKMILEEDPENSFTKRLLFPSDRIIKFPYYWLKRVVSPEKDSNDVYSLPLKDEKFSVNDKTLWFHASDPNSINNNDMDEISFLNCALNRLSEKLAEKGVKLIVLPVADKLDYYFEYLEYSRGFQKTKFFELLGDMDKKYIYIDSYEILKSKEIGEKDIFFYDDTHWSPRGAKILADEIILRIAK
jgi:hypothetical protein